MKEPMEIRRRERRPGNHPDSQTPPNPSVSFITKKVLKFNLLFESLGLVPHRPTLNSFASKKEMANGSTRMFSVRPEYGNWNDEKTVEDGLSRLIRDAGTLKPMKGNKNPMASNAQVIFDGRSLEVLRKFHWMILGGRFNWLSHVSSPLSSKPLEY
ncbi:hypothetical protein Tco_0989435 [Tanacetum coccineum]|uniref:Uncharacterized protein n=1 Tax=Tanacetum coccineum TaxID=301880 RepID=A0ABQ5ETM7_9ASTR